MNVFFRESEIEKFQRISLALLSLRHKATGGGGTFVRSKDFLKFSYKKSKLWRSWPPLPQLFGDHVKNWSNNKKINSEIKVIAILRPAPRRITIYFQKRRFLAVFLGLKFTNWLNTALVILNSNGVSTNENLSSVAINWLRIIE